MGAHGVSDDTLAATLAAGDGAALVVPDDDVTPVSYTHLTLPTNSRV